MEKRDLFGSRLGVLLALAGSAVGLGNLWRFPYLVGSNGGAMFIILYLFFVFIICLPLMFTEFVIGRRSHANVFGAFRVLSSDKKSLWSKIGFISVLCSFTILSFYSVVGGWTIDYLMRSCMFQFHVNSDYSEMFNLSTQVAWRPLLFTAIFLILTGLVVRMGVKDGIEKFTKVMMPILFLMVILVAIRSVTLPGAGEGLRFLFKPDFSKLTATTVLSAMGQAFFSLSIGCGTIITYASYVDKSENIMKTSSYTALMDLGFALLAGMAIMPAVFAFGQSPTEGPGLVFIIIPQIFAQIPFGSILAILFFFILFFAAITSSISLLEVVVAYLIEEFEMVRRKAVFISFTAVCVVAILCSLSLGPLQEFKIAGFAIFDFLDKLSANILLPAGGLLFVLFAGWKMPDQDYINELTNEGTLPVNRFLLKAVRFIVKYVAPIIILLILITGFVI